jgi:hypothetical protein
MQSNFLLKKFCIISSNLGYFVLDNTFNNNITLQELGKRMGFDTKTKRLRCMGYVINLIAAAYFFGQDAVLFDNEFKKAGLQCQCLL